MTVILLRDEAKISKIARVLRPLKEPERASALLVAIKGEFPLVDVERLLRSAINVERARRTAMGRA